MKINGIIFRFRELNCKDLFCNTYTSNRHRFIMMSIFIIFSSFFRGDNMSASEQLSSNLWGLDIEHGVMNIKNGTITCF